METRLDFSSMEPKTSFSSIKETVTNIHQETDAKIESLYAEGLSSSRLLSEGGAILEEGSKKSRAAVNDWQKQVIAEHKKRSKVMLDVKDRLRSGEITLEEAKALTGLDSQSAKDSEECKKTDEPSLCDKILEEYQTLDPISRDRYMKGSLDSLLETKQVEEAWVLLQNSDLIIERDRYKERILDSFLELGLPNRAKAVLDEAKCFMKETEYQDKILDCFLEQGQLGDVFKLS